ncbi:protease inhibitor I9 family protein [Kitasatospora sp. NPDC051705]|uniref:protease inhibitor I9 family protein n=1 Tax=Kitasatospora sp. NPDC051705 TaxID=3364057 RepID=UPI0037B07A05
MDRVPGAYEAPLFSAGQPQSERGFLIHPRYWPHAEPAFPSVLDILTRHGVDPGAARTRHGLVVGADLTADQLAAVRADRQVEYVERDCVGGVARYQRVPASARVVGQYSVAVADDCDLGALLARLDGTLLHAYDEIHTFAARLTDRQRDLLRRDPEVFSVGDDQWDSVD